MPCVLHHASKEEESKIIKHDSCPWIVRLRTSHNHTDDYVPLPPSFSPTLIVSLLSFKSFKIDKAGPHQYRNIFTLQFSYKGDVIIIERQLQLEVYYFFSNKECFSIRSDILEAILETKNRLSISDAVQIEESFPCSCTPHQIEQCQPRHTLHEPPRHILCQPDTPGGLPCAGCNLRRMECDLNDQQLRWLRVVQGASVAVCPTACATACNLSKPLTIDDLNDVLSVIRNLNDWMDLGLQLGLLYPTLERIDLDKQKRTKDCNREMLVAWLKKEYKVSQSGVPSWSVLKAALNEIGEKELAAKIN